MSHPKIALCFGTRPEVIKLFPVIAELRERLPREALRLICTGQHDALLDLCLDLLGGEPDVRLEVFERGQPLTSLVSRMLSELGEVLRDERPDVLVVQGDTATTMAGVWLGTWVVFRSLRKQKTLRV